MNKIPWNKKYLEISKYVVLTVLVIYILSFAVDAAVYVLTHLGLVFSSAKRVLGYVFSACSLLVIAFVISYLLDPLVTFFQNHWNSFYMNHLQFYWQKRFGKPEERQDHFLEASEEMAAFPKRTAGTLITYIVFFCGLTLTIGLISWRIGGAVGDNPGVTLEDGRLVEKFLLVIDETVEEIGDFYHNAMNTLKRWGVFEYAEGFLSSSLERIAEFVKSLSYNLADILVSAGSGLVNFVLGLVVAFYFLRDKASIKYKLNDLIHLFFPRKAENMIKIAFSDIHKVFSGYIRGQITDALIVGTLLSIGFSLIGLNFAVLIGLFSGFANIVPYLGAVTGFILSVLVALLSGEPMQALWAAIIVIVIQQIDGVIISPRVVGDSVELSPVLLILSLSVAGYMFGLSGMIFAVPVCALLKIFLTRIAARQRIRREAEESEEKV